jgi:major membrane immunogen (membrane-anchored lipoprotein)
VGQTLYIVKDSTLSPAPEGSHETREGFIVTLDGESTIIAIASKETEGKAEVESGDMMDPEDDSELEMVKATDSEGKTLESPTFDVGENCYYIKEDGSKEPCPDGEHQVILKDESGKENKIRVQVKDGKITQRENVEDMMKPEMMNTDFSKDISDIKESINNLLELVGSMNGKFKTELNSLKTDLDTFKKSPERVAVEEKKTYTQSFSDYQLELIKSLRK